MKKNKYVTSRAELKASLAVGMGGRVAEELLIGEIGVGAYDDLKKASELATMMVEGLGMSDLGPMVFQATTARGQVVRRDLSPDMALKVDTAIQGLVTEAYAKAGYPEQMSRVRRAPRAPPPDGPRAQIMLEHGINYLWIGGWALLAAVFAVARRAAPVSL